MAPKKNEKEERKEVDLIHNVSEIEKSLKQDYFERMIKMMNEILKKNVKEKNKFFKVNLLSLLDYGDVYDETIWIEIYKKLKDDQFLDIFFLQEFPSYPFKSYMFPKYSEKYFFVNLKTVQQKYFDPQDNDWMFIGVSIILFGIIDVIVFLLFLIYCEQLIIHYNNELVPYFLGIVAIMYVFIYGLLYRIMDFVLDRKFYEFRKPINKLLRQSSELDLIKK